MGHEHVHPDLGGDETEARSRKRDDETFDELLDRLAVNRTAEDVRETAGFGGEGVAEGMKKAREELNESLEERSIR